MPTLLNFSIWRQVRIGIWQHFWRMLQSWKSKSKSPLMTCNRYQIISWARIWYKLIKHTQAWQRDLWFQMVCKRYQVNTYKCQIEETLHFSPAYLIFFIFQKIYLKFFISIDKFNFFLPKSSPPPTIQAFSFPSGSFVGLHVLKDAWKYCSTGSDEPEPSWLEP